MIDSNDLTVTASASVIFTFTGGNVNQPQSLLVQNNSGTDITVGGPDVVVGGKGVIVADGKSVSVPGSVSDNLYGISASGTVTVQAMWMRD